MSAEDRPLASPLAAEVRLLTETLERQRQAIDHGVVGAGRVTELLTTLETRISSFTNVAQTVADLELRAVEANSGLEQRVGEFESQRRRIEQTLSEATRLVDAVSARELLTTLETRISSFTKVAQTVADLELRAVEASTDLEQRVGEFESQRRRIEQTLSEATRRVDAVSAGDLLTTLETRVSSFTNVAQTVANLELRAVEASTDLEQRVGEFESQRRRIERALSEATRLVDAVSTLEQRLSGLTESSGVLERATGEQRSGYGAFYMGLQRIRAMVSATGLQRIRRAIDSARNALPAWAEMRARPHALAIGAGTASLLMLVLLALAPWRHDAGGGSSPAHPATGPISPTRASGAGLGNDRGSDVALPDSSQKSPTGDPSRSLRPPAEHARDSVVEADAAGGGRPHNFTGDLTIESEPERATVFINQKRVGETPVHLKALRAGSLAVRIERDGYERWTAGVLVAAERQTRVSAKLERSR